MRSIKSIWLLLIPMTGYWIYTLNVFGAPSSRGASLAWLALGIALGMALFFREKMVIDRRYISLSIPAIIAFFIIPHPYNIGFLLLSIGLAGLVSSRLNFVSFAAGICGIILIMQSVFILVYYKFIPNAPGADLFVPLICLLSKLTGLNTSASGDLIIVSLYQRSFIISTTWNKLGIYPLFLLILPMLFTFRLCTNNINLLKSICLLSLYSIAYLVLRYVTLLQILFSSDPSSMTFAGKMGFLFVGPISLTISFLPFVPLFALLIPEDFYSGRPLKELNLPWLSRRHILPATAIFIAIFLLTSAFIFHDPGLSKEGRILVDERSIWETSCLKLDKSWYGDASTYNSYSMIEWLKDSYKTDRLMDSSYEKRKISNATKVEPDIVSDVIDAKLLSNYDILIIKTPGRYAAEEIKSIKDFVFNGGGLFLIGDHSDFAGTGSALNEISEPFGIKFNFDSVNDRSGLFSIYIRDGLSHPVLKYMPFFNFLTSCSLDISPLGEQVIEGASLLKEPGEYATGGFFRLSRTEDITRIGDADWGIFNQVAAAKYGQGRIVAFTDSTTISNFRIFFGGSPNLVMGAIEYLNKANKFSYLPALFLLLGMCILAMALFSLREESVLAIIVILIVIGSLGASTSLAILSNAVDDVVPAKYYNYSHTLGFDSEHSSNIVSSGGDANITDYETFLVWTQRANLTPFLGGLEECMERGRAIAVVDPAKEFTAEEKDSIKKYLSRGGSLLMMVNGSEPGRGLIGEFKMKVENITADASIDAMIVGQLPISPWGPSIVGGEPLKKMGNRTILSRCRYGNGQFLLFVPSYIFKSGYSGNPGYMGFPKTSLRDAKYDISSVYNLEYYILDELMSPANDR